MSRVIRVFFVISLMLFVSGIRAADVPENFQPAPAPGTYFAPKPGEISLKPFQTGDPIIATSYFYWYDIDSKAHFLNSDGSDALTDHPVTTEGMSWKNPKWHETQFRQMTEAGIDVAIPVYWGSPTPRQPGGFHFSDEGVPHMVKALDAMLANGEKPPTLGMFYDTSTLANNAGNYQVDLTTDAGKRWFYATIRNFFSMVPPKHRATVDGKPLVFLYAAAFAKDVDDTLFPAVREMFRDDFGSDLYIVKAAEWPGDADSVYQWGAALNFIVLDAAAIGPGYDHSAVPGRTPLVRSRDDGDFYTLGWERLLRMNPKTRPFLVHLETWNEFHEGTDICESREFGTFYLELTKKFAKKFHEKERIREISIAPKYPEPSATPGAELGVTAVNFAAPGDGPVKVVEIDDHGQKTKVWTTIPKTNVGNPCERFFYFDVDATFLIEQVHAVELTVVYRLGPNAAPDSFALHYDSYHPALKGLDQAFRGIKPERIEHKDGWNIATFRLPEPRFENRSNGSDFRLFAGGDEIVVKKISLRKLQENAAKTVELPLGDMPLATDSPVSVAFSDDSSLLWRLTPETQNDVSASIIAQKSGDRLWWIQPAGSVGTQKYSLAPYSSDKTGMKCVHDAENNAYTIFENDRPVLRYNFGEVPKPDDVVLHKFADGRYYGGTRGDYIHPIYGFDGEILTDDFPADHPHHRGLWWSWPVTRWNSRVEDIWAVCDVRSYPVAIRRIEVGPVMTVIEAESEWRFAQRPAQSGDPLPEDSDKPFVRENAVMRVFASRGVTRFIDTDVTLTALEDGVAIGGRPGAGYGGITMRTAKADSLTVTCTPDPEGKITEPATVGGSPDAPNWIDVTGNFPSRDGVKRFGMTLFEHPKTPGYPDNRHLYPPIFCFMNAFPGDREFALPREESLELRARLWIHSGDVPQDDIQNLGRQYGRCGQ